MERDKTVFDYIESFFKTFGIVVTIFTALSFFVGDMASEYSAFFILGSRGLTTKSLAQLFVFVAILELADTLFMTDKWIKDMKMVVRNILFFLSVFTVICIFAYVFHWFPFTYVGAWIGFFICYFVCTGIGTVLYKMKENAINKKMEQALRRIRNE